MRFPLLGEMSGIVINGSSVHISSSMYLRPLMSPAHSSILLLLVLCHPSPLTSRTDVVASQMAFCRLGVSVPVNEVAFVFLPRHVDAISALETRISLLGMTIMRYVEEGYCAFFPGKVLDEMRRVFGVIRSLSESPQCLQLMKELRDISSMAMEYFDEQLLPRIQQQKCE